MARSRYAVTCPTCGAEPGRDCRATTSGRVTDTHVARMDADPPNLPHDLDRVVHPGRHTADCCGPVQGPNNSRQNSMADLLAAHLDFVATTLLQSRSIAHDLTLDDMDEHTKFILRLDAERVLRALSSAGFGDTRALLDDLRVLAAVWSREYEEQQACAQELLALLARHDRGGER